MKCKYFNVLAYKGAIAVNDRTCTHPDNIKGVCPYVWIDECPKNSRMILQQKLWTEDDGK